jgi:3-phosphoshikimate 1-carboxyvinyltransferase
MLQKEITIQPFKVKGNLTAPASKSAMQRICAAALIAKGTTHILNSGISNDDKAALAIIQNLGAQVIFSKEEILIRSQGVLPFKHEIDCGESGLSIRMFTPIAALHVAPIKINGHGSLQKRPMEFFTNTLPQLDVKIKSENNFLPFEICGPLVPKNITVDGSQSSQYITGLLMAYAYCNQAISFTVSNLASKPYIGITLKTLAQFGFEVTHQNFEVFTIHPVAEIPKERTVTVEGDWSSASFHFVAAAINGQLHINGLDAESPQADKAILEVLKLAGIQVQNNSGVYEIISGIINPFHFDATDCPDLFPPIVALASYANGVSIIKGINRLTHKESNRAITLQEEFGKLGITIVLVNNEMHIHGTGVIKAAEVSSQNDHRIAMACAVAAAKATGTIKITGADAVNKSYPNFWEDLDLVVRG